MSDPLLPRILTRQVRAGVIGLGTSGCHWSSHSRALAFRRWVSTSMQDVPLRSDAASRTSVTWQRPT